MRSRDIIVPAPASSISLVLGDQLCRTVTENGNQRLHILNRPEPVHLADLDECENFIEIILSSLPRPLIALQRPLSKTPRPTHKKVIEQAFEFERLLDERVVNNRAGIAERYGISRARVTQVLNLLKLPREILVLLADTGDASWGERQLRDILALPSQDDQITAARAIFTKPVQTAS